MPDSQIDEVKSKVDIVQIIGEHVSLTKSGSNFRGLCPFHQEKTPSFMVSPELQIYKCFGCGEGGDVFTFLEKYEGMEFSESLKFLADKAGVKLAKSSNFPTSDKDILYELNNLAAKFYNYLLTSHSIGKVALGYVKDDRKITPDSIKTFNLGYAPAQNALSNYLLNKKKYKLKDLERAGLVFVTKSGKAYDRFEGRIIFPISDHRGNMIALAGRLLPPGRKDVGKYINSSETPIYHKSSSLYGLNITKDFIKKEGFTIVVEGEIDLISSYQIGLKNIVAIKGSAFTPDQARLLLRYTTSIVLALDSDFAGVAASIRGIKILEDAGFEVKVATLGKYKDPDEASVNPDFFKERIAKAIPVWDFIIDSIINKYDKNEASGKAKISKELTPILGSISNKIVQEHYVHKIASLLDVSDEAVAEEVDKKANPSSPLPDQEVVVSTKTHTQIQEEELISLLLKINSKLLKSEKVITLIQTPILKRLVQEFNPKDGGKSLPKELFEKFAELKLKPQEEGDIKKQISKTYKNLLLPQIVAQMQSLKGGPKYLALQKLHKDLESDKFESII